MSLNHYPSPQSPEIMESYNIQFFWHEVLFWSMGVENMDEICWILKMLMLLFLGEISPLVIVLEKIMNKVMNQIGFMNTYMPSKINKIK
jgi:hypothetical protein